MIKTTKTDFKQKQVFHDDVDIKGKLIVQGADDIVDETGKKIIDTTTSGVTLDTEQTITGVKHFKTGSYELTIGSNDYNHGIYADAYGLGIYDGLHITEKSANEEFWILHGTGSSHSVYIKNTNLDLISVELQGVYDYKKSAKLKLGYKHNSSTSLFATYSVDSIISLDTATRQNHTLKFPSIDGTIALNESVNATTALTLTNVSGHRYTGTISTSNKVECIVDIDGTYTANFNIAKGMKTAFLMVYGTSSTDVATCFATMDSSGLVTIDLDNVSLSSFTPTCKYIIYN